MGEGATPLSQLMKVPFQIPWPHTRRVTFRAVGGGKSRLQIIIEIFNSICSDCTRIMGVRVPRDSVGVSPVGLFVPHENPAIEDTLSLVHHLPAGFLLGFQGTLRTHNISIYARYTNPCYADALCRQGADILYIDKFPRFPCSRSRSRSHFHPPTYLPTYGIDSFASSHWAPRLPGSPLPTSSCRSDAFFYRRLPPACPSCGTTESRRQRGPQPGRLP